MKKTKKEIEKEHLRDFCEAAKRNDYALPFAEKLLSNDCREDENQESPDFIKNFENEVMGIEEFSVSSNSTTKNKKNQSFDFELNELAEAVVDNVLEPFANVGKEKFCSCFNEYIKKIFTASYDDYIKCFKQSLEKHVKNVEKYIRNVSRQANGKRTELSFLITINHENDNLGMFELLTANGSNALFKDMYEELTKLKGLKIKYIMLLFKSPEYLCKKDMALLIDINNIESSIKSQSIKIKEYGLKSIFEFISFSMIDAKEDNELEMIFNVKIDKKSLLALKDTKNERNPKQ